MAEIRGLPVPELDQEGVATPEDYLQSNLDAIEDVSPEDKAEEDAFVLAFKMLQLVPDDYSIKAFAEDYTANIAGFYSIEKNALVLIGGPDDTISPFDEMILAHEYTHALQDATFDLGALQEKFTDYPDDEAGKTSYGKTLSCIIEGDATVTEYAYMEEVYGPYWYNQIEYPADSGGSGSDFPEFLERDFGFNYNDCYYFVLDLYSQGGWAAVNAAFEDPPATSEQILHPEKYASDEAGNGQMPADLTKDTLSGWTLSDIGQFGEYDVFNYILTITGDFDGAYEAGAGWGSGWLRMYLRADDAAVLQFHFSFDSQVDLTEFENSFDDVLIAYGVDTTSLEQTGVQHFTIPGETNYFGVMGAPGGTAAIEILLATDATVLNRADDGLR